MCSFFKKNTKYIHLRFFKYFERIIGALDKDPYSKILFVFLNQNSMFGYSNTLENHCTRTTQSSCCGCSRRVHKIVYLAVNKGNILVNFLLLKIFIARIIITYKSSHVSAFQFFVGLVIVATPPE